MLRKELIEWCDYERCYERKHSLLNLTKLKLVANKKGMQFEKSVLKKDLLTKISDALTVRATLSNNNTALQKYFTEKMITCVFKSSFLKRRVASSQESKYCKLGHRLESILVKNLMKDSLKKECTYDTLAVIEVGLAMKMGNNLKTKSLQTRVDFLITMLIENNEV